MSLLTLSASLRSLADDRRRQTAILAGVGLLVLCSMDLWQLVFGAAGAVMYATSHALAFNVPAPKTKVPGAVPRSSPKCAPPSPTTSPSMARPRTPSGEFRRLPLGRALPPPPLPPAQPARQPSVRPVVAPTFSAVGFDAEVSELVAGMAPTEASERFIGQLADRVEILVAPLFPEARVVAYASSSLNCGAAFRVAVPEVELVVCACPARLASLAAPRKRDLPTHDHHKLLKAALRSLTDHLINGGPFKFRRSAFRSVEPKVTLHVPSGAGVEADAIPVEVSINSATPGFNAALVTECGRIEPRAKDLILLVKRWAKDRGACHAAKGQLSPYGWTLLAVFFLQAGVDVESPLLPPLAEFQMSSTLAGIPRAHGANRKWTPSGASGNKISVGALFKEFIRFYAQRFDFEREAVCISTGHRAPPCPGLPLVRFRSGDGATLCVAPSIEDPFDCRRNLSDMFTEGGFARMTEELARADRLCAEGASLGELLTPWSPPP